MFLVKSARTALWRRRGCAVVAPAQFVHFCLYSAYEYHALHLAFQRFVASVECDPIFPKVF